MKIYQRIAQLLEARENCQKSNNSEWFDIHTKSIEQIVTDYLPHGSGIDAGVVLDLQASNPEKIVLLTSYHRMDGNGFYDGWNDYKVIITPSLAFGMNIKITGKNRNDIKEYLYETFEYSLTQEWSK